MRCLLLDRLGRQQTRKGENTWPQRLLLPASVTCLATLCGSLKRLHASTNAPRAWLSPASGPLISVRESKSTPSRQKRDRSPNVTGSARRTSISFITYATRNCPEPAHGYCPKHDVRVFVRRPSCHSGCTRSEKVRKPAHAGRGENKLNAQCMSSLSMFLVQLERLLVSVHLPSSMGEDEFFAISWQW